MNKLDRLRKENNIGYVEVLDEYDDIKWNREVLYESRDIGKKKYSGLISFGSWLKSVERVDIRFKTDVEITKLFNKYFFELLRRCKKCNMRGISYLDIIEFYNKQWMRCSYVNEQNHDIVYLGNVDWYKEFIRKNILGIVPEEYTDNLRKSVDELASYMTDLRKEKEAT